MISDESKEQNNDNSTTTDIMNVESRNISELNNAVQNNFQIVM